MNDGFIVEKNPYWDEDGHNNNPVLQLDVVLFSGETEESLMEMIHRRFGVEVKKNPIQYNSAVTLLFSGTEDQLRKVKHWWAASHKPRPDLKGKAPVAKGERRVVPCRCGYFASSGQDLDDHIMAMPDNDPQDHGEAH